MVVEEVANVSTDVLSGLIIEIGKIGLWLQALGILAFIWFISIIIGLIVNRKKRKEIYAIRNDLKRIEKKIDKLSKK